MWKCRFWFDTLGGAQACTFLTSGQGCWCCGSTDHTLSIKRLKPSLQSQCFYYYEGKKVDNEGQENKSSLVLESSLPNTVLAMNPEPWLSAILGVGRCRQGSVLTSRWERPTLAASGACGEVWQFSWSDLLISVSWIQCVLAIVHWLSDQLIGII